MIELTLVLLGLLYGSFISALVWRIYQLEQKDLGDINKAALSPVSGRSMCPKCHHQLGPADLIPLFSWLIQRGKCRYCHASISWQYPLIELSTVLAFVGSYIWWPNEIIGFEIVNFGFWLVFIVGLLALAVYDLRWMILPNVIIYPLIALAMLQVVLMTIFDQGVDAVKEATLGLVVLGGLFYGLFEISKGRWIGGGDVKLGFFMGILLGPALSLLALFIASLSGTLLAVAGLITKKSSLKQAIAFGPHLILGTILVGLFGQRILDWYNDNLLGGLL